MTWLTSLLRRPPIGWLDLADILVVSILIYEVLKLIRKAIELHIDALRESGQSVPEPNSKSEVVKVRAA